jgi:hypothetical protein
MWRICSTVTTFTMLLEPTQHQRLSAPGRTRTCNPRIRSPTLYPFELLGRGGDILIERYVSVKLEARFG